jgi:polysaccharide deacetylase 2 family uncharacterized protein YibQ
MSRKIRKKRATATRRKKKNTKNSLLPVRIFSFFILLCLLLFSIGAAGYVIFFRTTIAHGATVKNNGTDIAFEEPYTTVPELSSDIPPGLDSSLPMVAIIIDDMGYYQEIGHEFLALPMNLTFSFLAAAPYTMELEEMAFQAGRVVLLHQPMEPKSKDWDPGPGTLFVGQSKEEQKALFYQNLHAVPHAVGVNNHMGSFYTEDRAAMDDFMQLICAQGLFFVDSFTTAASQGLAAAKAAGVPAARRHIFLDNVHSQDKVCNQLQKLVKGAEENGWAIGIGHPNAATLAALTNCRGKLLNRVRLVSVQELLIKLNKP